MKKYQLQKQNEDEVLGTFDSKQEAANEMEKIIDNNNDELDEDDSDWLTPFDFTLKKEIEVKKEINEIVDSYEAATRYLGYQADVKTKISDINPKHIKALIALNTLFTIADAWNKADGFVPDFSNGNQRKFFPWFVYDKNAAGFVCAATYGAASYAAEIITDKLRDFDIKDPCKYDFALFGIGESQKYARL